MPDASSLIVRRNARVDVSLLAMLSIAPAHLNTVRLAANPNEEAAGRIFADVIDLSIDGMGLIAHTFIPRRCLLDARVYRHGDPEGSELLHATLRVHRVVMTDRRPAYFIGACFEEETDESRAQVREILRAFGGEA